MISEGGVTQRETQIGTQLEALCRAIDELSEMQEEMEERLNSVLANRPNEKTTKKVENVNSQLVPLADRLQTEVERIVYVNQRYIDIVHRLELP